MFITVPDPHPGRCKNLRPHPQPGVFEYLRCVHMDGHNSRCDFETPKDYSHMQMAQSANYYQFDPPKPWKDPTVKE